VKTQDPTANLIAGWLVDARRAQDETKVELTTLRRRVAELEAVNAGLIAMHVKVHGYGCACHLEKKHG
jgi:hypothetical protein